MLVKKKYHSLEYVALIGIMLCRKSHMTCKTRLLEPEAESPAWYTSQVTPLCRLNSNLLTLPWHWLTSG